MSASPSSPSSPAQSPPRDLAGRSVTVMGLGRFGGGVGAVRWLCAQGARVLVTDINDAERLAEPLVSLRELVARDQVRLRLGEHRREDFTETDLVIANPAVPHPWDDPYLCAATAAQVPITTEIRLLVERLERTHVIGVTGTAGKSTTSAMITHLLRKCGRPAHWGGNIGGSLLDFLPMIRPDDLIVLELSSFMLHWLGRGIGWPGAPVWSPGTALLTNLAPNHLDWHLDFAHYAASKENIFGARESAGQSMAAHNCHLRGDALPEPIASFPMPAGVPIVPGEHNRQNARMAMAVVSALIDVPAAALVEHLRTFRGLPHRLEVVLERDGMRFINDSKSTTPESTVQAIAALGDSMPTERIHLIAGGYDKGSDLSAIAELAPRIARMYTIGATATKLARHANADAVGTLDNAVQQACATMREGDTLLLSPGCASWDQFDNYEHRGETFRRLVHAAEPNAERASRAT